MAKKKMPVGLRAYLRGLPTKPATALFEYLDSNPDAVIDTLEALGPNCDPKIFGGHYPEKGYLGKYLEV